MGIQKCIGETILDFVEEYGALRTTHLYKVFSSKEAQKEIRHLLRNNRLFCNVGGEYISTQLPIELDYNMLTAMDVLFDRYRYEDIESFGRGDPPLEMYCILHSGAFVDIVYVENHNENSAIKTLPATDASIAQGLERIFIIDNMEQVRRMCSQIKGRVVYALTVRSGGFNYLEFDKADREPCVTCTLNVRMDTPHMRRVRAK